MDPRHRRHVPAAPGEAAPDDETATPENEPELARVALVRGDQGEPLIASSAMHDEYAGLTRRVFEWVFGPIEYPAAAADRIRELAAGGTIVYVARARTSLLGVYFNHALARLGLPLARFVGGSISLLLWQPVDRLWTLWRQRRARSRAGRDGTPAAEALLTDMAVRGEPAFVFLKPEANRRAPSRHDYLKALVVAQRRSDRPIYVIPHALVDRAQSGAVRGALGRRLFGAGGRGGRLRELTLLFSSPHATVRVADAIDLRSLIVSAPEADDAHLARRLAHEVHHAISEEERVIAGPDLPPFDTTKRHVLRSPDVRRALEAAAPAGTREARQAERRAARIFDEVAARYNVNAVRFLSFVMGLIFNRIYDGIVVDEEGLERLLEAARKGPIILCPSHKSHVDYLVLSYLLWQHGITPPHIAAGANLSFFPLGSLFRRAGAFFLRRSFRGDELYRSVFSSYVGELVRTGTSLEFFLEGTRSRSGKLGMPKFGILGMVVDAWRAGARNDVRFVPVSIDYERIVEAGSYERELLGGEKKSEDIGALLGATRVLRSRYGRVHVQFAEPISLAGMAARHGVGPGDDADPETWRRETERLGYRILYEVGHACMVTPTAVASTALLGARGRGVPQATFLSIGEAITEYLYTDAARLSDVLRAPESRAEALLEAVQKLVEEGSVSLERAGRSDMEPIYRVREEARIGLDFHKNAVMNYFAPASILARTIAKHGGGAIESTKLDEESRFLSRLFKREFIYRVDTSYTTHFDDALATLAVRGLLDVLDDGRVLVRDPETIGHLAALLDGFVEAYWITAQVLGDLRQFPLWDKELAIRARERARRAFLEGGIRRPEAASRTLIDTALEWMLESGVLEAKTEGRRRRMQLAPAYDGDALNELVAQIGSFL